MFGHVTRQQAALSQSLVTTHPSRRHLHGFRWITSVLLLAVMAALLVLLSVPVGHTAAQALIPSDQITDLEQQMFTLINHDRAAHNLPPYTWDARLGTGARAHSNLMASGCGLQHQCPNEPDPSTRITNEGVSWKSCGENIGEAGGYPSYSDDLKQIEQDMIDEGPGGGHYDNLMSTAFQNVGVGVAIDSNGTVWVTEDFVQPS